MQAWCDFWPSFLYRERLNSIVDELTEQEKDENIEQIKALAKELL